VTQLHVLAIYLVLGIGADDLFVFYDAWCALRGKYARVYTSLVSSRRAQVSYV
jgi:hypothetical protein